METADKQIKKKTKTLTKDILEVYLKCIQNRGAFAEALTTIPEFWLNLQRNWDLWCAKKNHIGVRLFKKVS